MTWQNADELIEHKNEVRCYKRAADVEKKKHGTNLE